MYLNVDSKRLNSYLCDSQAPTKWNVSQPNQMLELFVDLDFLKIRPLTCQTPQTM